MSLSQNDLAKQTAPLPFPVKEVARGWESVRVKFLWRRLPLFHFGHFFLHSCKKKFNLIEDCIFKKLSLSKSNFPFFSHSSKRGLTRDSVRWEVSIAFGKQIFLSEEKRSFRSALVVLIAGIHYAFGGVAPSCWPLRSYVQGQLICWAGLLQCHRPWKRWLTCPENSGCSSNILGPQRGLLEWTDAPWPSWSHQSSYPILTTDPIKGGKTRVIAERNAPVSPPLGLSFLLVKMNTYREEFFPVLFLFIWFL